MNIYLFKTVDPDLFEKNIEYALATTRRGSIKWNPSENQLQKLKDDEYVGWCNSKEGGSSLLIDTNCSDVMFSLAYSLSSPLLSIRFQEKSFWEASLFVGRDQKIRFSTCSAQWGENEVKNYFCDPAVLSEIWGVPVDKFKRYLVDWGLTKVWVEEFKVMSPTYERRGEKAYPTDTHEYGDLFQGLDFIRALGAADPQEGKRFIVRLPPIRR